MFISISFGMYNVEYELFSSYVDRIINLYSAL